MKLPVLIPAMLLCFTCLNAQQTIPHVDAERLLDLDFTQQEYDSMSDDITSNLERYKELHGYFISNDIPPAFIFNPLPAGFEISDEQRDIEWDFPQVELPETDTELAFYNVWQLASLIKSGQLSSERITRIYLDRIERYADTLECMVTLLPERALQQARNADREIAAGNYKGPLHGIPYGIKDLFALESYPTTWGANPYKDQMIGTTATVINKLNEAGAVLLGKLTLGALAMGDVWFGGKTRNPWNLSQGSSGSSAGSGSATAAGLVAFAIGTETLGSIVSPSNRNGVTGLRPTFGRVSRYGAMALSWSMDKVGPMCRSALDCAIVFDAIQGVDGLDQSLIDAPFNFDNSEMDLGSIRIGYIKDLFERDYSNRANDSLTLSIMRSLGAQLVPVTLPENLPYNGMRVILASEAAAAFDELTRSGADDSLVRQDKNAWPNYFRQARFIPAVEYIQANRARYQLIQEMNKVLGEFDVVITPTYGGVQLLATNLTGHPVIVMPNGFNDNGGPTSFSILGNLFQEEMIMKVAMAYQAATEFDEMHPPLFDE